MAPSPKKKEGKIEGKAQGKSAAVPNKKGASKQDGSSAERKKATNHKLRAADQVMQLGTWLAQICCCCCCWSNRKENSHTRFYRDVKQAGPREELQELLFGTHAQSKALRHQLAVQQYVRIASAASLSEGGKSAERELVFLRGPPGLGKSTFATKELSQVQTAANFENQLAVRLVHICSTDDFFTSISETGAERYHFEPKKIGHHHQRNQTRVKLIMDIGISPIYVDNTNITWWEMASYVQLADSAGYSVRFVEPSKLAPNWDSLEFLQSRNELRKASGKSLDDSILERMICKFEPLPSDETHQWLPLVRAAQRSQPTYVGVDVHHGLCSQEAGLSSVLQQLQEALSQSLDGKFNQEELLGWDEYSVPAPPLHVTTFYGTQLPGQVLAEAATSDGKVVDVEIEAIAFAPGRLACAKVREMKPAVPNPEGKMLHITLAIREPWAAKDSNMLLQLLAEAEQGFQQLKGDVGDGPEDQPRSVASDEGDAFGANGAATGDASVQGSQPRIEQHGPYLRIFRGLTMQKPQPRKDQEKQLEKMTDAAEVFDAALLQLSQPKAIRGCRFRCYPKK